MSRIGRGVQAVIGWMFILGIAALSGCSKDPSAGGAQQGAQSPTGAAPPAHVSVVRVWHTELDKDARRVLQEVMNDFSKANPGIKMEEEGVPWGQLNQKLVAGLAAGDVPDLVHLEPFMAASLYRRGQLEPLDDIYSAIGLDDVFPAVRDLQLFDGHRYGIAYGVGCTYWAVRKDLLSQAGLATPKTWADFIAAAATLTERDAAGTVTRYGVMIPGDPFFIDQLSCELIASNGGQLIDSSGNPNFEQRPVVEMLEFWRDMAQYAPPNWSSSTYLEQFRLLAAGRVSMVPVTYARALKNIEADAPEGTGNADVFGFIPSPVGPSGRFGFTTLDCEPWAILKAARHGDVARRFLVFLYEQTNYVRFCQTVPIHLTPIRISAATSEEYQNTPFVSRWHEWQDRVITMLKSPYALPILFNRPEDRNVPYLMELNGERVITDAVLAVAVDHKPAAAVAHEAQEKANAILKRLGLGEGQRP